MVHKITFDTVQDLFKDMVSHNQSFTRGQYEYDTVNQNPIIESNTPYRLVELDNGKLQFHSNKFGGADLRIVGNILSAEKIYYPDSIILSEYRLTIEGRKEPFVLLACKKRNLNR